MCSLISSQYNTTLGFEIWIAEDNLFENMVDYHNTSYNSLRWGRDNYRKAQKYKEQD